MPIRGTFSNQLSDPLLAAVTSDTFTGPQDLMAGTHAAAAQPCQIGVNYFKPGTTIRTTAWGSFSTTGTPTLVMGPYYGATVLGVNVALTTASGAATLPWKIETVTSVYSAAPNTAVVTRTHGHLDYGTTLTAMTRIPIPGIANAAVNLDNSSSQVWTVKATWSAPSSLNIVVLYGFVVEEVTIQ